MWRKQFLFSMIARATAAGRGLSERTGSELGHIEKAMAAIDFQ